MSEQEKAQDVVARPVVGLHTLIAKWRTDADYNPRETSVGYSYGLHKCANELEALLAVDPQLVNPADDLDSLRWQLQNALRKIEQQSALLAVSGRQEAHEQEKAVTRRDKQAGTDDDPPQSAIGDTWTLQSALRARREKDARMCAAALIVYRKYKDDPDVLALWGEAVVDPEPLTIAEIADTHRRHPEWLDEQHDPVTCPYCSSPATARPTGEHADDSAHGGTVPHPDYVELGSQIASERETWDLESYATVITIALKRAFAAGTAPHPAIGVSLIAAERQRQIGKEGWTPAHDDGHDEGELSAAAVCYAFVAGVQSIGVRADGVPKAWPFEPSWWKPSGDPVRNLVKAGALIAAEIDRLSRLLKKEKEKEI